MKISVLSQVVNGGVLPFVLIFMLLLINKKELMEEHVNSRSFNFIAWGTTVIMIVLTISYFGIIFGAEPGRPRALHRRDAKLAEACEKEFPLKLLHSTILARGSKNLSCGQVLYERQVGFEEVQFRQFAALDPSDLAEDAVFDFTFIAQYGEKT